MTQPDRVVLTADPRVVPGICVLMKDGKVVGARVMGQPFTNDSIEYDAVLANPIMIQDYLRYCRENGLQTPRSIARPEGETLQ